MSTKSEWIQSKHFPEVRPVQESAGACVFGIRGEPKVAVHAVRPSSDPTLPLPFCSPPRDSGGRRVAPISTDAKERRPAASIFEIIDLKLLTLL